MARFRAFGGWHGYCHQSPSNGRNQVFGMEWDVMVVISRAGILEPRALLGVAILAAGIVLGLSQPAGAQRITEDQLSKMLDGKAAPQPAARPRKTRSFSAKEADEADATPAASAPVPEAARPAADLEVYFTPASAAITRRAMPDLDMLGKVLASDKFKAAKFRIAGHTDGIGGAAYNLALSKRRAESVRRYIIAKYKIDGKRLEAVGYGKEQLKDANEPGSERNRRVQIVNLSAVK